MTEREASVPDAREETGWVVKNRHTGIVVAYKATQEEALDRKWAAVDPDVTTLIVEGVSS